MECSGFADFEKWLNEKLASSKVPDPPPPSSAESQEARKEMDVDSSPDDFLPDPDDKDGYAKFFKAANAAKGGDKRLWLEYVEERKSKRSKPSS